MTDDRDPIDAALGTAMELVATLALNVGAALAPLPGAVGLTLAPVVKELIDKRRKRVERLGAYTVEACSATDLLARIASDEAFGELLLSCLEAAQRKTDEQHLRALARALATIVATEDDADIDDLVYVATVIRDLTPAHLAAFLKILEARTETVTTYRSDKPICPVYLRADLERLGMLEVTSMGHVSDPPGSDEFHEMVTVRPTDFGQRVVNTLQSA